GLLADREVDAVDAPFGLEVEEDRAALLAELPVVLEPALFFQVRGVDLHEGAALDRDLAAELVFAFLRGRAQVPALLAVPDRVAGLLAFLEILRSSLRVNPRRDRPDLGLADGEGGRQGQ